MRAQRKQALTLQIITLKDIVEGFLRDNPDLRQHEASQHMVRAVAAMDTAADEISKGQTP